MRDRLLWKEMVERRMGEINQKKPRCFSWHWSLQKGKKVRKAKQISWHWSTQCHERKQQKKTKKFSQHCSRGMHHDILSWATLICQSVHLYLITSPPYINPFPGHHQFQTDDHFLSALHQLTAANVIYFTEAKVSMLSRCSSRLKYEIFEGVGNF